MLKDDVFCETVTSPDPVVEAEMNFSALQALQSGSFESTDRVQVLAYIVQISLHNVLKSEGLKPQAVIGHSVGDIAASVATGCLTPTEGAFIVTRRAKLYREVMGLGAMILVNRPFAEMNVELKGREDIVAAIDSPPSSCVIYGLQISVDQLSEA